MSSWATIATGNASVIGGLLGLLGGVIGIFGALVLFAFIPGLAVLVLLLVLFAVALSGAHIVLGPAGSDGYCRGLIAAVLHQRRLHGRPRRQRARFSGKPGRDRADVGSQRADLVCRCPGAALTMATGSANTSLE